MFINKLFFVCLFVAICYSFAESLGENKREDAGEMMVESLDLEIGRNLQKEDDDDYEDVEGVQKAAEAR